MNKSLDRIMNDSKLEEKTPDTSSVVGQNSLLIHEQGKRKKARVGEVEKHAKFDEI